MNKQSNMPPAEINSATAICSEKNNSAEAQDKDLKIPFIHVVEVLREKRSKFLGKKIFERKNRQWKI